MKGVELPINVLIIIVLVLIVLLAIIGFFFGIWNPGVGGIGLEAAKSNACQMLSSIGCGDPESIVVRDFDIDGDGNLNEPNDDNLWELCQTYYYISDKEECKTLLCHCTP